MLQFYFTYDSFSWRDGMGWDGTGGEGFFAVPGFKVM